MESTHILAIIIITVICLYVYNTYYVQENYGEGALIQLVAKGPEDVYLTGGVQKYIPEYWNGLYPRYQSFWNNSTRLSSYYYPPYAITPYLTPY